MPPVEDPRHEYGEDEESPFSKLIIPDKVKVLFLWGNGLTDKDTKAICDALAENQSLKVLDMSYNKITSESVNMLADLLDTNKTIEFLGLAKNEFGLEEVKPLLNKLGKIDFPSDQVADHEKLIKERDTAIEKNLKVKPGAPKLPVPAVDSLEAKEVAEGEDAAWFI